METVLAHLMDLLLVLLTDVLLDASSGQQWEVPKARKKELRLARYSVMP